MGCRGCTIFVAILLIIVALLLGGAYYMLTQPSAEVAGLPTIVPSKESAAEFDRKLSAFLADLGTSDGSGEVKTATLVVTEQEATSKLAEFVQSGQMGIDIMNPQVHFRNERVRISGDIGAGGAEVNLALQARIISIDGKAEIVFETVDFGGLGVPERLRRQVIDTMTAGAGSVLLDDLPVEIGGISIADGQLIIRDIRLP
ncbi:MAG: hypothetical protein Q7O66_09280 [Dehalococcoidia bacterium]|nr:hypothetical protein [Dehalococcoidia bacterium]